MFWKMKFKKCFLFHFEGKITLVETKPKYDAKNIFFALQRSKRKRNRSLLKNNFLRNRRTLFWTEQYTNYSLTIRKMYRCEPYKEFKSQCASDENCGINEYCAPLVSECRTKLPDGSLCVSSSECLNHCSFGVCSTCTAGIIFFFTGNNKR